MNDWIAVDTRLPDFFEQVEILVYIEDYDYEYFGEIRIPDCFLSDGELKSNHIMYSKDYTHPVNTWLDSFYYEVYGKVTHWQALPTTPKGKIYTNDLL